MTPSVTATRVRTAQKYQMAANHSNETLTNAFSCITIVKKANTLVAPMECLAQAVPLQPDVASMHG